jgi:hypothetical protein
MLANLWLASLLSHENSRPSVVGDVRDDGRRLSFEIDAQKAQRLCNKSERSRGVNLKKDTCTPFPELSVTFDGRRPSLRTRRRSIEFYEGKKWKARRVGRASFYNSDLFYFCNFKKNLLVSVYSINLNLKWL